MKQLPFSSPLLLSAPCAPQDVDVISQCGDASMVVSWSRNPDAQDFQVIVASNTGAQHQCNSSGTACTIDNLPCGQNYNVTVVSVRDGCESKPSTIVETSSGKYSPVNCFSSRSKLDIAVTTAMSHVFMLFLSQLRACPQMPMDIWTVCQTLPG